MPKLLHNQDVFPLYVSHKTNQTLVQSFKVIDITKDYCYTVKYYANEGSTLSVAYGTNPGGLKYTRQFVDVDLSEQTLCLSELTPTITQNATITFTTTLTADQHMGVNIPDKYITNQPLSTLDNRFIPWIDSINTFDVLFPTKIPNLPPPSKSFWNYIDKTTKFEFNRKFNFV